MKPVAILFVLPVLIGVAAGMHFRDARSASLAAILGSVLAVCLCVIVLDPSGNWGWLAALLVSPLPIAFAVGAVLLCHGRSHVRGRNDGHDARQAGQHGRSR